MRMWVLQLSRSQKKIFVLENAKGKVVKQNEGTPNFEQKGVVKLVQIQT